jgi:hypothetical protein
MQTIVSKPDSGMAAGKQKKSKKTLALLLVL